jgi:hypothetical protein
MKVLKYLVILFILLNSNILQAQRVFSYIINDFSEVNPAGLSTINNYQLNVKGFNSPEMDQFFNGGYVKLIAPINKINSKIGFHTQFFSRGDFSDIKVGLSYAYNYNISESSFLSLGLKASIFSVRDSYYMYKINGVSYEKRDFNSNKFNLDLGLWYQINNFGLGLSYNHINSPEHIAGYEPVFFYYTSLIQDVIFPPNPYSYEPEFNIMFNHEMNIVKNFSMNNSLIMYDLINMNELTDVNINNIFEINNTFMFGSAWEILKNEGSRIRFYNILGFNLENKYKIYLSLFSREFVSDKNRFIDTSKKVKHDFECSFVINI